MTLFHLIDAVVSSQPSDWLCSEYIGPLDHSAMAVYLPDVTLSLAFGHTANENFREKWANQFPDPAAYSAYADVLYQGTMVFRAVYVGVDGVRAKLPLPKLETMEVPRSYAQFVRLLDAIEPGGSEFDEYFRRAKMKISDETWPEFMKTAKPTGTKRLS